MKYRAFKHVFHEGYLNGFKIGANREITLDISLSPAFNKTTSSVRLLIGGIKNFEEVSGFFKRLPLPERAGAAICELYNIEYSKDGLNWVLLSTLKHGIILFQSKHVSEL